MFLLSMIPAILFLSATVFAQNDSVDIRFQYMPSDNPGVVHLPGEFNNWANNSGGTIQPDPRWTMTKQADGSWTKTVRLKIGGGTGPGGSYQYKFNEDGSSSGWHADPLNPRIYGSYGNSIVFVRKPTIYPVLPKTGAVVNLEQPEIEAGVFPATGTEIDTSASIILLDGIPAGNFGAGYQPTERRLRFTLPPVSDGTHSVVIRAVDSQGSGASDSTSITVKAAPLQWLTRSNPAVFDTFVTVIGGIQAANLTNIRIVRNGADTLTASVNPPRFQTSLQLVEGDNALIAIGETDNGATRSETIVLHLVVDHTPRPVIQFGASSGTMSMNAFASTDPDGDTLTYRWISEDGKNPVPLGIDQTGPVASAATPGTPGEYHIRLEARDPDGHLGIARTFITVNEDGTAASATIDGNARWVRDAIVYEIFVPAFSPQGTIRGVLGRLPAIRALGVNTLWLMPVMDNRGTVNEFNGGYDIIDLKNVDESLGSLADLRELTDSCHANGLRMILDITPNHVSAEHPWVNDIRAWGDYSIYRDFIETRVLGDHRGLGQSVTMENGYPLYAHYTNWALANLNLSNCAMREAMMDAMRFWLLDQNVDGFRLDVYWGPQARYGSSVWWRPFREKVKRLKPDVLVLGETDGTGTGSEANYADGGGACDAAYDWNWFGQIKTTLSGSSVDGLHDRTINYSPTSEYNHYTGPHARYFRFMENHDEDRIAQIFSAAPARTRPGAVVLLTAPGMPMLYAGQEIGWKGRRNRIDFSNPPDPGLLSHYTRLIRIRSEYPSLRSDRMKRLTTGTNSVYGFLRPYPDRNMVVAANFSPGAQRITIEIPAQDLELGKPLDSGTTYYLCDLLADTSYAVRPADLGAYTFLLNPFQSRVFLLSDSARGPVISSIVTPPTGAVSDALELGQSYPNPCSRSRDAAPVVPFTLRPAEDAAGSYDVEIIVTDLLGRRHASRYLNDLLPGARSIAVPGAHELPSGMYLYQITATHSRSRNAVREQRMFSIID